MYKLRDKQITRRIYKHNAYKHKCKHDKYIVYNKYILAKEFPYKPGHLSSIVAY